MASHDGASASEPESAAPRMSPGASVQSGSSGAAPRPTADIPQATGSQLRHRVRGRARRRSHSRPSTPTSPVVDASPLPFLALPPPSPAPSDASTAACTVRSLSPHLDGLQLPATAAGLASAYGFGASGVTGAGSSDPGSAGWRVARGSVRGDTTSDEGSRSPRADGSPAAAALMCRVAALERQLAAMSVGRGSGGAGSSAGSGARAARDTGARPSDVVRVTRSRSGSGVSATGLIPTGVTYGTPPQAPPAPAPLPRRTSSAGTAAAMRTPQQQRTASPLLPDETPLRGCARTLRRVRSGTSDPGLAGLVNAGAAARGGIAKGPAPPGTRTGTAPSRGLGRGLYHNVGTRGPPAVMRSRAHKPAPARQQQKQRKDGSPQRAAGAGSAAAPPAATTSATSKQGGDGRGSAQDDAKRTRASGSSGDAGGPVLTFYQFLKTEMGWGDMPNSKEAVRAHVFNFVLVPAALERFLIFGFFVCMDGFLHNLTYLPMRFAMAVVLMVAQPFVRTKKIFHRAQLYDLLRGLIYICSLIALTRFGQLSRVYHYIRGEAMIKLYVIFNILEIIGKLCAAIGQDAFDSLYRTARDTPWNVGAVAGNFVITLIYVILHSLLEFVQVVALNVAINSHSHALLTLMVSNNFIELKGSVFKKFGPENVLQIACCDAVERFQLSLYLGMILLQDIRSWESLGRLGGTAAGVLFAEIAIDWVKHSFITKFNRLSADVYTGYGHILVHDVLSSRRRVEASLDPTHAAARRMGFAAIPLTCLVLRLVAIKLEAEGWTPRLYTATGLLVWGLGFACLVAFKVLLSQLLLSYARYHGDGGLGNKAGDVGLSASPALVQWAAVTRYSTMRGSIPK